MTAALSCYCTRLRKATRRLQSIYDDALEPVGVSVAQFALLRLVRRMGPASVTDLADAAELERSTMGRNVQVLQRMGLLAATRGADQRETAVMITDEGRALLDRAAPLWDECQARIEARIGPEGLAGIEALLDRL